MLIALIMFKSIASMCIYSFEEIIDNVEWFPEWTKMNWLLSRIVMKNAI